MHPLKSLCRILVAVLTMAAVPAMAICPPQLRLVFVGPASDSQCNYHDLQTAIMATSCPQTIVVTRALSYSGQHLLIQDRDVSLVGGIACSVGVGRADAVQASTRTPITGDGTNPVISIRGNSHVSLSQIALSGGNGSSEIIGGGGGISFYGSGSLTLTDVEVNNNTCSKGGGGITFLGSGQMLLAGVDLHDNTAGAEGAGIKLLNTGASLLTLTLAENPDVVTDIHHNQTSNDGGGIYASGNVRVVGVAKAADRIRIRNNIAAGRGGGLELANTGGTDLALPGSGISANTAHTGGGISLSGTSAATLRLFSTLAGAPTRVTGNTATVSGGGLEITGGSAAVHGTVCVFDGAITDNAAPNYGTALIANEFAHVAFNADSDPECPFQAVASQGAVHCDPNAVDCNSIGSNLALNGATFTDAATLDVRSDSSVSLQGVHLTLNVGGSMLRGYSSGGGSTAFTNCLVDHNNFGGNLVDMNGAPARFDSCTFADDALAASYVLKTDSALQLRRSIVRETKPLYDAAVVTTLTLQHLWLNTPTVPGDSTVQFGDPLFVDQPNGDYRLSAASPALDYAPADGGSTRDFGGQQREVDLATNTNLFGPRDLGAYERQPDGVTDRIFIGTFQ